MKRSNFLKAIGVALVAPVIVTGALKSNNSHDGLSRYDADNKVWYFTTHGKKIKISEFNKMIRNDAYLKNAEIMVIEKCYFIVDAHLDVDQNYFYTKKSKWMNNIFDHSGYEIPFVFSSKNI